MTMVFLVILFLSVICFGLFHLKIWSRAKLVVQISICIEVLVVAIFHLLRLMGSYDDDVV